MSLSRLFKRMILVLGLQAVVACGGEADVLVVRAEGMADPSAEVYARDKGLLIDHLRANAQRNAVEKAVGCVVSSETLSENFQVVSDKILTRSKGFIRRILSEEKIWTDELGLVHLPIEAEVILSDVQTALQVLSRDERLDLIRKHGNPKLLVSVSIGENSTKPEEYQRSALAENLLKEHFSEFGYRIWSFDDSRRQQADFHVQGAAGLAQSMLKSSYNDLEIQQWCLNAWSIKCADLRTGEEIYINNTLPDKGLRWGSAEAALAAVAKMVGSEFSQDFFAKYLMAPTSRCQLEIRGVPTYAVAKELCRQFVGLRQVINVALTDFQAGADTATLLDVELAGSGQDLGEILDSGVVTPYNAAVKKPVLQLSAVKGVFARLNYSSK